MSWRYKVLECVGEGSGGKVYRARHRLSGRVVALKQMIVDGRDRERRARRVRREVAALSILEHGNIVQLYGVECSGERTALAMEFVDGATVHELLSFGPLPIDVTLYIVRSVVEALCYAHARGLVHRDVSPSNVLVSWDGDVKLADFGIAKLVGSTRTAGRAAGTPGYLAPEQIRGSDVDGRADLFAVGALFYALIVGRSPFAGETSHEMESRILSAELDISSHVPGRLAPIIEKLLSRARDARYATGAEVLAALPVVERGREQMADSIAARVVRPKPSRRPMMLGAVVAGLVLGVAGMRMSEDSDSNSVEIERQAPVAADDTDERPDMPRDDVVGSDLVGIENDHEDSEPVDVGLDDDSSVSQRKRAPKKRVKRMTEVIPRKDVGPAGHSRTADSRMLDSDDPSAMREEFTGGFTTTTREFVGGFTTTSASGGQKSTGEGER